MIDTTAVIQSILPDLHADNLADLYFWTEGELIRWEDECVKRLARVAAVFVRRDASLVTVAGQASYSLPPRHVTSLHVSLGTVPLRPANMEELEGLDTDFRTTPGTPERWYEDKLAAPEVAFAPVPDAAGVPLPIVYNSWPPELDASKVNTSLPAPAPVKGYIAMAVLGAAYQIEGESEMPDVASHCRGRLELYERTFQAYFGKGI